ncbi:DUF2141 domain-containing protein [Vulcaniibacterium tengchongense]|uniref:Uncharacterized protein (DUF2141 family) n=1 Tax=Vulcaniibacterium tengchongense TaxID=1273429 RepID=A0A3N4VAW9_9GAMM|nr:DUF2141 domain-containing protein [Vulcaniibacterium tengchongense]RPE80146.1 uncharacterized protein (DUF2141 family) [Vulcaniibacterium tengchongense]
MNRLAALASVLLAAAAADAAAADLTVHLRGVRRPAGTVRLLLVDSPAGWANAAAPVAARAVPADGEPVTVVFTGLKPGAYALMAMHDEDDDGRLDTNLAGLPTEGYGFSNDPPSQGKPAFEQARFELGEAGAGIDISLR